MKAPTFPTIDERRAEDFAAELRARAGAWIAGWDFETAQGDFGAALLDILARFSSEVTETLDRSGEKMQRGLLDWLGVRGKSARPSRVPIVFQPSATATDAVNATAPVRLQADVGGVPVILESEKDVRVVPGTVQVVVAIDLAKDAYYVSPPGLSSLAPIEPGPTRWRVKSFTAAGVKKVQLDPDLGIVADMVIEARGVQYEVRGSENGLVTIDRPLETDLTSDDIITQVTTFDPFGGAAYNAQQHALYIGDSDLLNIEAPATIELFVSAPLVPDLTWEYWGKPTPEDEANWVPIDAVATASSVVLKKEQGTVEVVEINRRSARWIRGSKKDAALDSPLRAEEIKLRVTSPPDANSSGPTFEAMANTTPLVVTEPFFPLGREPRQFDSFYLGSEEAFSKKGADVAIHFDMAAASFVTYAVRPGAEPTLAGIGKDNALYLFKLSAGILTKLRGPQRPIRNTQPVGLNLNCRPVIWEVAANDFKVAVAAGREIWVWHENIGNPADTGWEYHSTVPAGADPEAAIQDIVVLQSAPNQPGVVLSDGQLYRFNAADNWLPVNAQAREYVTIAPVFGANNAATDLMVAISKQGGLHILQPDGVESPSALAEAYVPVSGSDGFFIRPTGRASGSSPPAITVVAVGTYRNKLVAARWSGSQWNDARTIELDATAIGGEVTAATIARIVDGTAQEAVEFSIGAQTDAKTFVASWIPGNDIPLLLRHIAGAIPAIGGTPVIAGGYVVVPGERADAFVATFDPSKRLELSQKKIDKSVLISGLADPLKKDDFLAFLENQAGATLKDWKIPDDPLRTDSDDLYILDQNAPAVDYDWQVLGYRASSAGTGTITDQKKFSLAADDPDVVPGALLRVTSAPNTMVIVCRVVTEVDPVTKEVEVDTNLPGAPGNQLKYHPLIKVAARVVSTIEFVRPADGNLTREMLQGTRVHIGGLPKPEPLPQIAVAFDTADPNRTIVALAHPWRTAPASQAPIVFDSVIGNWSQQFVDISTNPTLSWEYWNGKAWWSLNIEPDETNQLAMTGDVKFTVPKDIDKTDWAGKTNFWIRARLVGGDYGREEVTVIDKPGDNGVVTHTIERSTENIRAPQVTKLTINYEMPASYPAFVEVKDSGTFRDLSDANRTSGAIVEAFVSLREMLHRLSESAASAATASPTGESSSPCHCDSQPQVPAVTASPPSSQPSTGGPERFFFIGLTKPPSEAPVNLLLLVEEQDHSRFVPMTIEALTAGRFTPIVADDATRALGESGLLQISFPRPPAATEIFGKSLSWLRLKPKSPVDRKWRPKLRGVYLNGAWASATETLTRELLGSSNGAPHLKVQLARPPVLYKTLELRVREPLGEEDRRALREKAPDTVKTEGAETQEDWVLWEQVVEPLDAPPDARVYALDEETGVIQFGDGEHGMIPPIGRDSIVAFRYQRTEPAERGADTVPGNAIAARTPLGLVSPLEGVDAVIAADASAGGSPPESDDRVLRFGSARLRHRDRAITTADLEQIALQSSPDIAQARALTGRGGVRLLIVMRGLDPRPNAAQRRELRRLLIAALPPAFAHPNALRIERPILRKLRIELPLRIETLEHAAAVSDAVKKQLIAFFDAATGGSDGSGWPVGANPIVDDIARAVIDTPKLNGIGTPHLIEVADDGSERDWPDALGPTALAVLAADPLRIVFETAEVMSSPR